MRIGRDNQMRRGRRRSRVAGGGDQDSHAIDLRR